MNLEEIAAVAPIVISIGAIIYSYARKDLQAYRELDALRDDLAREQDALDRRIERLETELRHSEDLRQHRFKEIVNRLDRHRLALNDQARFLQKHGFHHRVNGDGDREQ